MKILRVLVFAVSIPSGCLLVSAQQQRPPLMPMQQPEAGESGLSKFNLDFPGGTPAELRAAIEKATNKPLNMIVAPDYAAQQLPALKMNNVDVSQLFQALFAASSHRERRFFRGGIQNVEAGFGFRTEGKMSDNSIWTFFVQGSEDSKSPPPQVCRFYLLTPFLDRGLTVDDITTAVQTGWKMLGDSDSPPAKISFHKETKLLIAVGQPEQLQTIDAVLAELAKVPAPATKTNAAEDAKN